MEDNKNQKIITLSFVLTGFLVALVVRVLLETSAATWGIVAKYYSMDWVSMVYRPSLVLVPLPLYSLIEKCKFGPMKLLLNF